MLGFPESPEDHVFYVDGADVPYSCTCRFIELFEGLTYLAWNKDCPAHQPRPKTDFEKFQDDFHGRMIADWWERTRKK